MLRLPRDAYGRQHGRPRGAAAAEASADHQPHHGGLHFPEHAVDVGNGLPVFFGGHARVQRAGKFGAEVVGEAKDGDVACAADDYGTGDGGGVW